MRVISRAERHLSAPWTGVRCYALPLDPASRHARRYGDLGAGPRAP